MAERKINPKDTLLFIDPLGGTAYDTVVCLTGIEFGITNNEVDADSFCGPDKVPGTQEYSSSFDGLILADPDTGKISAAEIFELAKQRTVFSFKIAPAVPVEGDMVKTGLAFFSEYTETFSNDAVAAFTATLGIKGSVTQVVTP